MINISEQLQALWKKKKQTKPHYFKYEEGLDDVNLIQEGFRTRFSKILRRKIIYLPHGGISRNLDGKIFP